MVIESWFLNLWKSSSKEEKGHENVVIGVLSFEVASLMSKLVHLAHLLSDKQVTRLREEIEHSPGIKKLISEDDDCIVHLICEEMIYNLGNVARAVARLGKKCSDPSMNSLEHIFDDLTKVGFDMYGLEFSWKKMERKIKKMEKLISSSANLHQEMETLMELEQSLGRLKSATNSDDKQLLEYRKKVAWKRQEVKTLQRTSLWSKTYDYSVRMMIRSIFTLFGRIKHVFGIRKTGNVGEIKDSKQFDSDYIYRSQSVSALIQSAVHPSDSIHRFSSGPLGNSITHSGPISKVDRKYKLHSGPLGSSSSKSGPIFTAKKPVSSHSGPLERSSIKASPVSSRSRFGLKLRLFHRQEKYSPAKLNELPSTGPSKGCVIVGNGSAVANGSGPKFSDQANHAYVQPPSRSDHGTISKFSSSCRLLDPPPETLGAVALALHYANIVIVIERLFAAPHLISHEARDDLYNMLPSSVRAGLRARLKPCSKTLGSSVSDTVLATEWRDAMTRILEWLAPLAHNMVRWQSGQSYEQQNLCPRTNVLLVQTLYYANLEKTEATIIELLVGLNYIWRYGREINAKAFLECAGTTNFGEYLHEDS
ncbi:hypothetical protein Ancab_023779 [Ancistrocladus abbreviatus]